MIVTKSWLNEWIDLKNVTTETLAKTFNAIGLEVDRVESFKVPAKIVIGEVLECEKHPDADKLNVCKVDIGTSIRQIVCGASNVRAGIKVAVAVVGAQMPGGLKIKPVKLRGVESEGMICSSTEIGLPKLEDGIMVLDASIGSLKLGSALSENKFFNDDLIEIELTANRGDCLSIRGVARDLSAALNRPLKEASYKDDEERRIGIGRILHLATEDIDNVNLRYKAIDLEKLELPLLMKLRMAEIEESKDYAIENLLFYATYTTGVILRAYHFGFFAQENSKKALASLKLDENGYSAIYGSAKASTIGIIQDDASRVTYDEGTVLIEASYIPPNDISKKMAETKIPQGPHFYRTSRGSEPQLNVGLNYCLGLFDANSGSSIYGGSIDLCDHYEDVVVSVSLEQINAIIGAKINKTIITQILKNLGFGLNKSQGESFVVTVPRYRHDIVNKQDIVEEIVRMVGIDNIPSKAFEFKEENRLTDDYFEHKKRRVYRHRAAQSGFYESIHFVFNEAKTLSKYGFDAIDKDKVLLNPIAGTLDTLRPTLMMNLIQAASSNVKNGQKTVRLFEIGSVFSSERDESVKMGFLFSGDAQKDAVANSGKPKVVDFALMSQKVSDVIGAFTLETSAPKHALANVYQSANIIVDGKCIGELFKLHPTVAADFDLADTFVCELDFTALPYALQKASAYSKFQASFRDLSVVVPSTMVYAQIKEVIEKSASSEVIRFYPVDRYSDEKLGDKISLTLRFVLQSMEKTLEEDDITNAMSGMMSALEGELGLSLR